MEIISIKKAKFFRFPFFLFENEYRMDKRYPDFLLAISSTGYSYHYSHNSLVFLVLVFILSPRVL